MSRSDGFRRHVPLLLGTAVMLVWTLLPIYWTAKTAFVTYADAVQYPPSLLPGTLHFGNFANIFGQPYTLADGTIFQPSSHADRVVAGLMNSIVVSVLVVVLTLTFVVPLAYLFARVDFRHKGKLLFALLFSVSLPPVSTFIPFYIMFIQLKMVGTILGLVLVTLTITIPFITWMTIGYFRNLPPIEKLALVDGYGRFSFFFRLFVPMARNGIIVAGVLAFLFAWNEYTYAQLLVNGTGASTLATALGGFLFMQPQPNQLAAAILVSLVPPLLVSALLQKYMGEMNIVDPVR